KLITAALAGLALGALAGIAVSWPAPFTLNPPGWGWLLAGGAVLVLAALTAVLTHLTYQELSRLRPARWPHRLRGVPGLALALALGLAVLSPLLLLRWLAVRVEPAEALAELAPTADLTQAVMLGLAAGALLAYLLVANVFLYLHLRVEGNGPAAAPKRR